LQLDFDNDKLDKLESEWEIMEYKILVLDLKGEDEYLSFTKNSKLIKLVETI
jgi:hypothetical protein